MATAAPAKRKNPVTVFRETVALPAFREQVKMALPPHISADRFERVAVTAVQMNPDLLDPTKVERRSLFAALLHAAQDGLLPDGVEGVIIPYRGKAQWQPMVRGVMKKVRQSGEITAWDAFPVFERDTFQRLLGDDMRIYHEPYEEGDPGEVVGAYSIVTFRDGSKSKDYLPKWRIDRALAQNPKGATSLMRTRFPDEAAVKTVVRHHAKRLPQSTDIETMLDRAEGPDPPPTPGPERSSVASPPRRLDLLEAQIAGDGADIDGDGTATAEPDQAAQFDSILTDEAISKVEDARDDAEIDRIVLAYHPRLSPGGKDRLTAAAMDRLASFQDFAEPPPNPFPASVSNPPNDQEGFGYE